MSSRASIHPATTIGAVHLTVRDLDRQIAFYRESLGFAVLGTGDGSAHLGAGSRELLVLSQDPAARQVRGTTGLYHFAILVPSRPDLAKALSHLAQTGTPLRGASDHLVSEALYLDDLEGNGIEIYRDRPRSEWPFDNGILRMATEPLDLDGLAAEAGEAGWNGLPSGTAIGHVHLRVADIATAEAFYCEQLGFDLMVRYGADASFVSAGGYHHHLGFNVWQSRGASPPPQGATGLRHFEVRLPDDTSRRAALERLRVASVPISETAAGPLVRDPSMNGLVLTVAA